MQTMVAEEKKDEMKEFDKLMQEVAELPTEQIEKVSYFAQGVLAMSTATTKGAK